MRWPWTRSSDDQVTRDMNEAIEALEDFRLRGIPLTDAEVEKHRSTLETCRPHLKAEDLVTLKQRLGVIGHQSALKDD